VNSESVIRDLGTEEGTFLNSTKLEGVKPLKDGDVIRVGKHVLTYAYAENITSEQDAVAEDLTEEEAPIQMESKEKKQGWLQIMSGSNLGKTMSLNRAMTNLGKPGLSTAVITKREDGYFISHLEGKISPLVKNKEIGDKSLPLSDGDTIQIGNIKMQFYLE
jgi:pSer/pThr/pTyr-binding forkhead associated (FHA) protein